MKQTQFSAIWNNILKMLIEDMCRKTAYTEDQQTKILNKAVATFICASGQLKLMPLDKALLLNDSVDQYSQYLFSDSKLE